MLKDEIEEKKSIKKGPKKVILVTYQTCNLSHKTELTLWKTNYEFQS
jgi:hypothetical protein